jgi:hypothetical protein
MPFYNSLSEDGRVIALLKDVPSPPKGRSRFSHDKVYRDIQGEADDPWRHCIIKKPFIKEYEGWHTEKCYNERPDPIISLLERSVRVRLTAL